MKTFVLMKKHLKWYGLFCKELTNEGFKKNTVENSLLPSYIKGSYTEVDEW